MIEEIMKLRQKGMSFRKIAKEMNSTVGKVQYQWVKHVKGNEEQSVESNQVMVMENPSTKTELKNPLPQASELVMWLVNKDKVFAFWRVARHTERLVESYFEKPFHTYLQALRVYDVSSIIFNGSNAHQYQEVILPEGQVHWYLKGLKPSRCYCIEFGIKLSETKFFPLLRSNALHIPRDHEKQAGELAKELERFRHTNGQTPNWIEHVSTYSYYDKTDRRLD